MTEQERVLECLEYFTEPGDIIEIRAFLPAGAVCGWFKHENLDAAARAVADLERAQATGIYFTPNPVAPRLAARRLGQIGPATVCTKDADILRRRWLLIDIDPTRPTGSNASEAERAAAWQVASHVQAIMGAAGLVAPVIGSSGNGWHLCYPIDWTNDDDSRTRHKIILAELAKRCDTAEAAVDTVTYNAARIWKLYGTRARKGPDTGDRPQRIAFVASAPAAVLDEATREINNRAIEVGLVGAWARQTAALQSLERQRTEPDTVARARAYLAKIPGAVSGSGGHGQTYHAAMELVERNMPATVDRAGAGSQDQQRGEERQRHRASTWRRQAGPARGKACTEAGGTLPRAGVSAGGYTAGRRPRRNRGGPHRLASYDNVDLARVDSARHLNLFGF